MPLNQVLISYIFVASQLWCMHRTQEPRMSHCNIRNNSLKVQCLDSHHIPCGQRSGSSERQVRVCQFPGNCITHSCGDDCRYLSRSLVSSAQMGYKSMIKFWKVIKRSVSISSKENTYHGILNRQTGHQPAVLGDEGRALYKPTLSTRAFQDLMKLGTGKKPVHCHSSLWSHLVGHRPTGSSWHLLCLYFLMVLEKPATSIMFISNSQTIHSENQAADLCSPCSERPFPMVTGDSSDNTISDHSSLLCSNTLTHSSINQPGATGQASHRNGTQRLTKSRRQTNTVTIWELTEGKTVGWRVWHMWRYPRKARDHCTWKDLGWNGINSVSPQRKQCRRTTEKQAELQVWRHADCSSQQCLLGGSAPLVSQTL